MRRQVGLATTAVDDPATKGYVDQTELASANKRINVYSISSAATATDYTQNAASGFNSGLIAAYWDREQASAGAALTASAVTARNVLFDYAAAAGNRVLFEIAIHYPPTWFQSAAPQWKDQSGTLYTGDNTRDWVFSTIAWNYVRDYIMKVFASLKPYQLAMIDTVRIGSGPVGELNYPPPGASPQWWCFSAAALGSTDLMNDQTPNPGTSGNSQIALAYPFASTAAGTAGTAADQAFYTWYNDALITYMRRMIRTYREAGWEGPLHVLHPSWGYREAPDGPGDTTTPQRQRLSQGLMWARQMDNYGDTLTYPWCTWANSFPPATPNDGVAGWTSQDYSPVQYIYLLAKQRGMDGMLGCEPAAGATNLDAYKMWTDTANTSAAVGSPQRMPDSAINLGYRMVMWVADSTIDANGTVDYTTAPNTVATRRQMEQLFALTPVRGQFLPAASLAPLRPPAVDLQPSERGYLGWTKDPRDHTSANVQMATGIFYAQRVKLTAGFALGASFYVVTAGTSVTSAYVGLVDRYGNQIATSPTMIANINGVTGIRHQKFTNPVSIKYAQEAYVVLICTGGTMPFLLIGNPDTNNPASMINLSPPGTWLPPISATLTGTGPTIPATFNLATAVTTNRLYFCGVYGQSAQHV